MKKIAGAILLLVIAIGYYVYLTISSRENMPINILKTGPSAEEMAKLDPVSKSKILVEKQIRREVVSGQAWDFVNDFRVSEEKALEFTDKKTLADHLMKTAIDLDQCLDVDFCGDERKEGERYFDENETYGHKVLKRDLKILSILLKNSPDLKSSVDIYAIKSMVRFQNMEIQNTAIEILLNYLGKEVGFAEILDLYKYFKGTSAATFLANMRSKAKSADEVEQISFMIRKIASEGDMNTVSAVAENFDNYKLTKDLSTATALSFCKIKKKDEEQNWKAIRFGIDRAIKKFDSDYSLDRICH